MNLVVESVLTLIPWVAAAGDELSYSPPFLVVLFRVTFFSTFATLSFREKLQLFKIIFFILIPTQQATEMTRRVMILKAHKQLFDWPARNFKRFFF
jgi:hypothetical protein